MEIAYTNHEHYHAHIVFNNTNYSGDMDFQRTKIFVEIEVKTGIDEIIKVSEIFEDFLKKCADFGVLVEYNPDHKIDLKSCSMNKNRITLVQK